jgi:hypothetical protein
MPFQSIPSFQINPQRAKLAKFLQISAVSGTYYTVLDAIGRGKIYAIMSTISEWDDQTDHINLRITIDGKQEIINPANSINSYFGTSFYQSGETYPYQFTSKFDYIVELNFSSTVKVEIMQNFGTTTIQCNVQYGLE